MGAPTPAIVRRRLTHAGLPVSTRRTSRVKGLSEHRAGYLLTATTAGMLLTWRPDSLERLSGQARGQRQAIALGRAAEALSGEFEVDADAERIIVTSTPTGGTP